MRHETAPEPPEGFDGAVTPHGIVLTTRRGLKPVYGFGGKVDINRTVVGVFVGWSALAFWFTGFLGGGFTLLVLALAALLLLPFRFHFEPYEDALEITQQYLQAGDVRMPLSEILGIRRTRGGIEINGLNTDVEVSTWGTEPVHVLWFLSQLATRCPSLEGAGQDAVPESLQAMTRRTRQPEGPV